jgi:ectoine hydroxylase-related dioxygenase (phytanoyl-CoA dioxygenase family)
MFSRSSSVLRLCNRKRNSSLFSNNTLAFQANIHRLGRNTAPSEAANALKEDGCVVLKSFISPSQATCLNGELDAALASTKPGKGAVSAEGAVPGDEETHKSLYGANTRRLADLLTHSKTWREELVNDDALHAICSAILTPQTGEYWLSTAQMIEVGPGSKAQPLHADGGGWWPFWVMPKDRYVEYYLNFLIATTDTTCANGATGVVKGSHDQDYLDIADPINMWNYGDEQVEQIELRAGDCLLIGGKIVHRGGENKTRDEKRRVLSCMVLSSSLTPEEAHALTLDKDLVKDLPERAKKFLGLRSMKPIVGPGVWLHPNGNLSKVLGF